MSHMDRAVAAILALLAISVFAIWLGIAGPIMDAATKAQPSEWLGFFGNIIAAFVTLLAAGIAWMAVQRQIRDVQGREERAREQHEKGAALSIFVKLNRITGSLHEFNDTIQEARAIRMSGAVKVRDPWGYVKPLATLPDRQHITSDEKALLVLRKRVDLFNIIGSIDDVHNHYRDLIALFGAKRNELTSKLPPHEMLSGPAFMVYPTKEQTLELAPLIADLNQIVSVLESELPSQVAAGKDALERLTNWINSDFGTKLKVMRPPGKS